MLILYSVTHGKVLYQQEIKHFIDNLCIWSYITTVRKLHRVNHYTKWNKTVKHLIKMKVYTANITVSGPHHSEQYGRKNTPNSFTGLQRKFPHTKYSSRQLIYTKATRIFLQHQILILYTALFGKGQFGSCWCHWKESLVPCCTESLIRYFTRQDGSACMLW